MVRDLLESGRKLSAVTAAGFLAGLLVGGIGSRLAMLILRLTSDPSLHGVETDDGFIIGQISTDSFFLIGLGAVSGLIGAVAYFIFRVWVPERWRAPVTAVLFGTVGGALIIKPGGIDFTALEPLWLAIALFIIVPAAQGWLIGVLVEKFLRDNSRFKKVPLWLALLPILTLGIGGPIGLAFVVGAVAVWVIVHWVPAVGAALRSQPVTLLARTALAACVGFGTFDLVRDAIGIL